MNLITDTWRQLVRRRLWPVALLLVAAAAAVPFLLGKTPEEQPTAVAPANAAAANTEAAESQPVVALVDDKQAPAKRRRVLGAQKDPFEPKALPKVKKAKKKPAATKADATATPAPSSASGSGSSSGGSSAPAAPAGPVATPAPVKTYPHGSLEVRFGKTDDDMKKSTLERLKVLPSGSPVLVFTGLKDHGRTATFMLTGDVTAEGDGHCDPSPDACETLELRKGETEFITVTGADGKDVEYELDLLAIHN